MLYARSKGLYQIYKKGYTRPSHLASIDIRNNRLSRIEALKLVKKYEGKEPPSLEIFLELVGITKEEFMKSD